MAVRRTRGLSVSTAASIGVPVFQSGTITSPGVSTGNVAFGAAFNVAPIVHARVTAPNVIATVEITNITATGFTWTTRQHGPGGTDTPAALNPAQVQWTAENGDIRYA